ncbi:MAG: holo-ACP synthase [Bacillota bacterium]|jgi:holo-[acyl-carrier protein] synthase
MAMIVGLGVDIVEIERIRSVYEAYPDRFLSRLLSAPELAEWQSRGRQLDSLAGIWAAKEAVAKALGTGVAGFLLVDLQITHDPQGRPQVSLVRGASALAASRQIQQIHLSISHSRSYAVAVAIAESSAVLEDGSIE